MTLPELLARLSELAPERFNRKNTSYPARGPVIGVVLTGQWHFVSTTGDVLSLALLSAALMELVTAKGWRWGKLGDGDVWIDGPRGEHHDEPIGHAEPDGQPFALTLARAALQALEAEG